VRIDDPDEMNSTRPTELSPGGLLARGYRIVQKIGEGNMGCVYEAVQMSLDRRCALKQTFYYDQTEQSWFRNEAVLLSRLNHPCLPQVHDYFEESGSYFLVMDLISGPSLRTKLREAGAIPSTQVLKWAKDVLGALVYMHQAGIIHRDIKPDNIRIDGDKAFLVDFGLAKEMSSGTVVPGHTPDYSAPEQIDGKSNAQTDIYSLGATLYNLLTGERPARASDRRNALINKQTDPLRGVEEYNRKVPKWLSAVINKAMAFEPSNRFESAQSMLGAIAAEQSPPNYSSSNRQASSRKGRSARGSEQTDGSAHVPTGESTVAANSASRKESVPGQRGTTKRRSNIGGNKRSESKTESLPSLPLPSPSCLGCLLLIGIIIGAAWYFWPRTRWLEVSCEPQWAKSSAVNLLNPLSAPTSPEKLELTVEQVGIVDGLMFYIGPKERESKALPVALGETRLRLAVKILPDANNASLNAAHNAYLIDSRGTRYDLRQDNTSDIWGSGGSRTLLRNEVYRFDLFFSKIEYQTPYLYFNHPKFQPMKINLKW
jgi:serine/threonine protein kinase